MQSTDRIKLRKAGFRIFRQRLSSPTGDKHSIWEYVDSWVQHSKYRTQTELFKGWHDLMLNDKHIGDN